LQRPGVRLAAWPAILTVRSAAYRAKVVVSTLAVMQFLNSREKAGAIWAAAVLAHALTKNRSIAHSILRALGALFAPKLSLVWATAAAYAAGLVVAAYTAGLWHTTATKETVYWFVGTAAVLTGSALTTRSFRPDYAKRVAHKALRAAIIIEFLLNLYVLPLAAELVLVPLVAMFVMMQVVAANDPKLAPVRTFLDRTLMLIGLGLLAWVAVSALTDLRGLLTREHAESLLLVPAFTLAFVTFLYGVMMWSRWDTDRVMRRWQEGTSEEKLAA
jgi:hypothetical protein